MSENRVGDTGTVRGMESYVLREGLSPSYRLPSRPHFSNDLLRKASYPVPEHLDRIASEQNSLNSVAVSCG